MIYSTVIAKYKEDLYWTSNFRDLSKFVIYDKSDKPIENSIVTRNVGREAETYIRYIVDNYHNLPEKIVFLQGNPFNTNLPKNVSVNNFEDYLLGKIKTCNENEPIVPIIYSGKYDQRISYYKPIKSQIEQLFQGYKYKEHLVFIKASEFVVHKSLILNKPFEFWKRILNLRWKNIPKRKSGRVEPTLYKLPNAWMFEYIWYTLFLNSVYL